MANQRKARGEAFPEREKDKKKPAAQIEAEDKDSELAKDRMAAEVLRACQRRLNAQRSPEAEARMGDIQATMYWM